ncbi:MAG: thioredoxin family protein [Bacilli bacterium]|nr:thioredoxin family protein [Bacilli bacterium]
MSIKKKVIILVSICLVILVGAFIGDKIMSKTYLNEIKYEDLMNKIQNKEDVILLISQTTCSHCASYKPKLEKVANKYKLDIYYIDVDLLTAEEEKTFESYIGFDGTPVTVFLKNGEETTVANRINGNASTEKIEKKLKSNGFID